MWLLSYGEALATGRRGVWLLSYGEALATATRSFHIGVVEDELVGELCLHIVHLCA